MDSTLSALAGQELEATANSELAAAGTATLLGIASNRRHTALLRKTAISSVTTLALVHPVWRMTPSRARTDETMGPGSLGSAYESESALAHDVTETMRLSRAIRQE